MHNNLVTEKFFFLKNKHFIKEYTQDHILL